MKLEKPKVESEIINCLSYLVTLFMLCEAQLITPLFQNKCHFTFSMQHKLIYSNFTPKLILCG